MLQVPLQEAAFDEVRLEDIAGGPVREGYLYWKGLCGDRAFPTRDELKPFAIRTILRHLVLIKVLDGAADFHMAIVGDDVQRAYGVPLNNRLLSDIVKDAPLVFPGWMERYRKVALSGRPLFYRVTAGLDGGQANFLKREAVVLPLGENGSVTHVVTFGKHELKPGA